jgi:xanthine dehydrogenase YagT iron-sulfur-binding subunit
MVTPEVAMTRRFSDRAAIAMTINGEPRRLTVPACATLLDVLRDELGLTGAKRACDRGTCGACTVLVDDRRIYACLALAAAHDGRRVLTIEGLARGGELHPVQRAFVAHDALQCGYCTAGQILSAVGLLGERRATDEASLREQMSGNLCRCGAYPNIVAAIRDAAGG